MKIGDKLIYIKKCFRKNSHTIHMSYEIINIIPIINVIILSTNENTKISIFDIKEIKKYFMTNKQYRKLKLQKINENR